MKPTDALKEEHKVIKLMLDILETITNKLERGDKVEPSHLEQIREFIRVFADKCHHGKEEDLLFPALEEVGIPREGGPIGVMLTEHEMGRDFVKKMSEGISEYTRGGVNAALKIIENARNYIMLLRDHIDKEDNILYMMADMHLSPEKQEEILEQFEKIERERIGEGVHEKFHKLIHKLAEIYL